MSEAGDALRVRLRALVAVLLPMTFATVVVAPAPASAATIGYRDFAYGTSVTAPTGQKPQSKLWFNDGIWWGSLYNPAAGDFQIHRYDWPTHTWTTTGTLVDERSSSFMDTLWNGTHLYVATAGTSTTTSGHAGRVVRYSYSTASKTYSIDAGFPVTITNGGVKALVLAEDSTGMLWVTYTGGSKVWVAHSTVDDRTWVAPYQLPVGSPANIGSDELSAVVAYDGDKVGLMWSNQVTATMYFATHLDGAPGNEWTVKVAYQPPEGADDHINLKSLAGDSRGRVFAAVKTSLNGATDALVNLLVLHEGSTWTAHTFGTVADQHTRAIVLLDPERNDLYMFASAPCCSGGTIYMKKAKIDAPSFAPGRGTPFIQSDTDVNINNPTSTKQNLTTQSGLLVAASDDHTRRYLHNRVAFAAPPAQGPETAIVSRPPAMTNSSTAFFEYESTPAGNQFECSLDGSAFASCPTAGKTYSGLADGGHRFDVRAVDGSGVPDPTPASATWTIDTVAPSISATQPPDRATSVPETTLVTATFSEPVDPTTVNALSVQLSRTGDTAAVAATVSYDAAGRRAVLDPDAPLAPQTSYTATVTGGPGGVRDLATNPLAADISWSFTTGNGVAFGDDYETGDFSAWTEVVATGGATATVVAGGGVNGSFGARFSSAGAAGSRAYARRTLDAAEADLTLSASVRVTATGDKSSIPFMRLLDADGNRIVSLQRRPSSSRLQVVYGGNTINTPALMPLGGAFQRFDVHVIAAGAGTSTVEVFVDGVLVHRSTAATLNAPARIIQLGNDASKQTYTIVADNIVARRGGPA